MALNGVRMNGIPLVASSPTGFDPTANMQMSSVDIRQFPQNPMLWTPRSSMDGMTNDGIPPPPPYQLPPMRVSSSGTCLGIKRAPPSVMLTSEPTLS